MNLLTLTECLIDLLLLKTTARSKAFAEWTTPRAWYLCSWWPALVTSR